MCTERKILKYKRLVNKLKKEFEKVSTKRIRYEVEFFAIIRSFLEAVQKYTINNMSRIFKINNRAVLELWIKRMVIRSVKRRLRIWNGETIN